MIHKLQDRKIIKSANRFFLGLIVIYIAVVLVIGIFSIYLPVVPNLILSQMTILIPALVYLLLGNITERRAKISFRPMRISNWFMVILFTFLCMPLMTVVNLLSSLFVTNGISEVTGQMVSLPLWQNLILLAVLPAIGEELAYRGIIYHSYRSRGVLKAALFSGFLFGIMHMNFNQFSYAFLLGIIFALVVEVTGSIWASMLGHFIVNGANVFLLWLSEALINSPYYSEPVSDAALEAVDMGAGSGMFAVITMYLVIAAVATPLAGCVLVWMANHNGKGEYLKEIFRFGRGRKAETMQETDQQSDGQQRVERIVQSDEQTEQRGAQIPPGDEPVRRRRKRWKRGLLTPANVIGIIICVAMMILFEL